MSEKKINDKNLEEVTGGKNKSMLTCAYCGKTTISTLFLLEWCPVHPSGKHSLSK